MYLSELPQPLYEYLVLVGTTGIPVFPDEPVFPPLLIDATKVMMGKTSRDYPDTFNMLQISGVLFPLRVAHTSKAEASVEEKQKREYL